MNRRLLVWTLVLLACSASVALTALGRKPATHTVVIEGMQFKPATLAISPGDSIVWVNKDIVEHTATTPASAKQPFDSRMIKVGESWSLTFKKPGTYDYICTYHPTMKGVIRVQDEQTRSSSAESVAVTDRSAR